MKALHDGHVPTYRASQAREKQARQQLGVTSAFHIYHASHVMEVYTEYGVFQVQLPRNEFLVGMVDAMGTRRLGMVRFEGLSDKEGC
ncbi:hypothetical protein ACW9ID_21430 [Pseudomonas gingeri]